MRLHRQTLALGLIGIIDLFTTLVFVHRNGASEGNPIMALFLRHGLLVFLSAKLGFLAAPLAILESARRYHPAFVARAVNGALAAYLCLYVIGVARINAAPYWEKTEYPVDPKVWSVVEARLRRMRARESVETKTHPPNWPIDSVFLHSSHSGQIRFMMGTHPVKP